RSIEDNGTPTPFQTDGGKVARLPAMRSEAERPHAVSIMYQAVELMCADGDHGLILAMPFRPRERLEILERNLSAEKLAELTTKLSEGRYDSACRASRSRPAGRCANGCAASAWSGPSPQKRRTFPE